MRHGTQVEVALDRGGVSESRGAALVAMIMVMIIVDLIIVSVVIGGARDHDLTVRRADTIRAMYAAEAGMNMALRELIIGIDEDGDLVAGSISDDGDPGNDPSLGTAQFSVISSYDTVLEETTLTSTGRAGDARREMQAELK